jgi:hypothetical protein
MSLRSAKELLKYEVSVLADRAGHLADIYFDDKIWAIRYLVIDLDYMFPGRKVLISPRGLGQPDWEAELLPLNLTLQQLIQQPDIRTVKSGDPHLRSLVEVLDYQVQAMDGESGCLKDFVLDDRVWTIRHVVIEVQPHKQVSLIPQWIKAGGWQDSKVWVNLSCKSIENCPEYFSLLYTKLEFDETALQLERALPGR